MSLSVFLCMYAFVCHLRCCGSRYRVAKKCWVSHNVGLFWQKRRSLAKRDVKIYGTLHYHATLYALAVNMWRLRVCVCMHVYVYVYAHGHEHGCMHACMHTCTHAHTHSALVKSCHGTSIAWQEPKRAKWCSGARMRLRGCF